MILEKYWPMFLLLLWDRLVGGALGAPFRGGEELMLSTRTPHRCDDCGCAPVDPLLRWRRAIPKCCCSRIFLLSKERFIIKQLSTAYVVVVSKAQPFNQRLRCRFWYRGCVDQESGSCPGSSPRNRRDKNHTTPAEGVP